MEINYKYLRDRRKELKFTQKEMAVILNLCDAAHYSKVERGAYKMRAEWLPILAKKLKCKMTNFFIKN